MAIRYDSARRTRNGARKKYPRQERCEDEHRIGHSFAGHFRDTGKDRGIADHQSQWLKHRPDPSQCGLFVANAEPQHHQRVQEIRIMSKSLEARNQRP
jgi:hypothetical protein